MSVQHYFKGDTYNIPKKDSEKFGAMLKEYSWIVGYDFAEDISWHDSGSLASMAAEDTANMWMRRKDEIEKEIKKNYSKHIIK